jgi:hypothetical protein
MKYAILVALLLVCAATVNAQLPGELPSLGPQVGFPRAETATILQITSGPCPTIVTGKPYQCQFTATGGTPPYHWSVAEGILPPGLFLSDSGLLSGTVYACDQTHTMNCFITPATLQMILAGRTVTIPVETPKHHAKKKKVA